MYIIFFFDGRIIRQTGPGHPPRLTRKPPECGAQRTQRERDRRREKGLVGVAQGHTHAETWRAPHILIDASWSHPACLQLRAPG